ncbi:hypothetical protein E2C01_078147 [Portunus trituberculatus]|uniref:Uncharacterized protein n=1 Tax=Portunus trituberculatus TaxID=210409 RepID=A0A5B7IP59_PORTR|nr:hypothetical protein [Portunus trituberculatus]
MLVRSPVRGQTKWFLRRLPVDQQSYPLEGSPNSGRPVLDGWVSRLGCFWRVGGVLALSWTNFLHHVGPFFKTIGPHGDEVPRPRQPALAPIVVPVVSHEVADLAHETSSSGLSRKKDSSPQGSPTAVSCSGSSSEGRISAAYDSLLMFQKFATSRLHVGLCTVEMGVGISSMPPSTCPKRSARF